MTLYIPVGAIVMIILILGLKHIYPWINPEEHAKFDEHDLHLIQHKAPWLNLPFFIGRMIVYLAVWTGMTFFLRKLSLKEDMEGGIEYFKKIEFYSKVYIFLLAFTFIGASVDWIMSIDPTWFSTLFAIKNFVLSFYHGSAMIILIAYFLNKDGYPVAAIIDVEKLEDLIDTNELSQEKNANNEFVEWDKLKQDYDV